MLLGEQPGNCGDHVFDCQAHSYCWTQYAQAGILAMLCVCARMCAPLEHGDIDRMCAGLLIVFIAPIVIMLDHQISHACPFSHSSHAYIPCVYSHTCPQAVVLIIGASSPFMTPFGTTTNLMVTHLSPPPPPTPNLFSSFPGSMSRLLCHAGVRLMHALECLQVFQPSHYSFKHCVLLGAPLTVSVPSYRHSYSPSSLHMHTTTCS